MKDFLLVFRSNPDSMAGRSPEEMQAVTKGWMDWIGSIAAQNKLTDRGNRLDPSGKVVRHDTVVTDGPYTELKETIGGYSIIRTDSMEDAILIARGCPIFSFGGNVEVREISMM